MIERDGFCGCGCGVRTAISTRTDAARGDRRGLPKRYLRGHQPKRPLTPSNPASGSRHYKWRGGRKKGHGYISILQPEHPRSVEGYVLEHVVVAERALGKALPDGAVVHHVNGIKNDNRPCNLAILPGHEYHADLHHRLMLLRAGANPFTERICGMCRRALPIEMFGLNRHRRHGRKTRCKQCRRIENDKSQAVPPHVEVL